MSEWIITIDGPAGSGKSTLAKMLARHFDLPYIDTGSMYRAVAFFASQEGFDWQVSEELCELASGLDFEFKTNDDSFDTYVSRKARTFQKLGDEIRSPDISMGASHVAKHPALRQILVEIQRRIGKRKGGVLEGRDAGTVIFPDASIKFYLTATPEIRAKRRHQELVESLGKQAPSYEKVLSDVRIRDEQDMNRKASPLKPAENAIWVDSSDRAIDELFHDLCHQIKERLGEPLPSLKSEL